jgi:hypothetical protein
MRRASSPPSKAGEIPELNGWLIAAAARYLVDDRSRANGRDWCTRTNGRGTEALLRCGIGAGAGAGLGLDKEGQNFYLNGLKDTMFVMRGDSSRHIMLDDSSQRCSQGGAQ